MTMTTKKILIILGLLMAASSGYAYADGSDVIASNGITVFEAAAYFDAGPIALDRSGGSGQDMVLANGITQEGEIPLYDIGPAAAVAMSGSVDYGSAAGGMSSDEPYLDLLNGITDFTGGPQAN